jgi:hypothetical protein
MPSRTQRSTKLSHSPKLLIYREIRRFFFTRFQRLQPVFVTRNLLA